MTRSVDHRSLVPPHPHRLAVGEKAGHLGRAGGAEPEARRLPGKRANEGLVGGVDLERGAGPLPELLGAEDVVGVAVGGEDAPHPEVGPGEVEHAVALATGVDDECVTGL
jgi:hypothetical protein